MPAFTAFDIVVLLMIVLGAVMGAARGFVTEVLSLLAWVAGAVALRLFYKPVAAAASGWVGTESGGAVLAFALVFVVTFAVFRAIANNLGHRTRNSVIGPVDRFLGFGFGRGQGGDRGFAPVSRDHAGDGYRLGKQRAAPRMAARVALRAAAARDEPRDDRLGGGTARPPQDGQGGGLQ